MAQSQNKFIQCVTIPLKNIQLTTKILRKLSGACTHEIVETIIELRSIVSKKCKNLWGIIFNGIHIEITFFNDP